MRSSFRGLLLGIPVFSLLLAATVMADDAFDTSPKVRVGGYSFWQFGQIVKGYDRVQQSDISHQWQNNVLIGLALKAQPTERLNLNLNPEFYLNYPYPQKPTQPQSVHPFGIAYIKNAYGSYTFGDLDNPLLQASIGMFSFKYNPDGRNFGDYLFRTGTYPTYIINDFDYPAARLLGLHISSDFIKDLHADLLFTSEAFIFPLWDFSLTGIASYKFFNAVEIGAGIDFARCLPVMDSLTTPHYSFNTPQFNSYIKPNGDTGYYSFKATKVMARASIDPKPFFGSPKWLGPEDLKLYGEICWVGIEGYNAKLDTVNGTISWPWYNDLNERTPRMVGFNIPAFRLLDVFSFELEYFPSLIPDDYYEVEALLSPVPTIRENINSYDKNNYNKGFWRWSLYAKKMIVDGFTLTGEAAFDHLRTTFVDGSMNQPESLIKAGDWHWMLKFGYSF